MKNKKITLKQVKEYFKNAKKVECEFKKAKYDLTKIQIVNDIHKYSGSFCIDFMLDGCVRTIFLFWDGTNKFAKIISYKEPKLKSTKEQVKQCYENKEVLNELFPDVFDRKLEARELMIGNLVIENVSGNKTIGVVSMIKQSRVSLKLQFSTLATSTKKLEPISLTENLQYKGSLFFDDDFKSFRIITNGIDYDFETSKYPFIHQLQNLYFALTNEELIINL